MLEREVLKKLLIIGSCYKYSFINYRWVRDIFPYPLFKKLCIPERYFLARGNLACTDPMLPKVIRRTKYRQLEEVTFFFSGIRSNKVLDSKLQDLYLLCSANKSYSEQI